MNLEIYVTTSWIHKDFEYIKLVYINKIPHDLEHKKLAEILDRYEDDKYGMEKEFDEYIDKFIETFKGKS